MGRAVHKKWGGCAIDRDLFFSQPSDSSKMTCTVIPILMVDYIFHIIIVLWSFRELILMLYTIVSPEQMGLAVYFWVFLKKELTLPNWNLFTALRVIVDYSMEYIWKKLIFCK